METVVGLMVVLFGVSHGVETYCDGRQDGAQCYGALGGTVVLQLMEDASEIYKYQWFMNTKEILHGRNNVIVSNLMGNRSFFRPHNGTFRINDLNRNDGGEYILLIFDSNGHKSQQRTLQLSIQAPVSSVLLVYQCLSQGEKMVSCSAEGGDSPQYSWTLDGQTLKDTELISVNHETNNITLKQHVSGHLVCLVRNDVSSISKEERISPCGFIINCTLSNGTNILQWVLEASNTLCAELTTAPTTITKTQASAEGVETYCDARQDGAQCYGALGGTVVLQLMDSISEIYQYQWIKNTTVILHGRKNKIASNLIENRSFFTPSDGTFRINNMSRNDGGEYTLSTFDANGWKSKMCTVNLSVQAPVTSVQLVSECLSQGEMRVSCSSEGGDSPQYNWTLDGQTLTDAELISVNNETNIITLKYDVSGHLVCSVRNHISHVSREETISPCKDHSTLVCGLQSAVASVSLVVIVAYFYWKKRKCEKLLSVKQGTISQSEDSPDQ